MTRAFSATAPFGLPAFQARTRITVLAQDSVTPIGVFREVGRSASSRGAVLMESAAQGAPAGVRSLLIPRAVMRVVLRGGDARFVPLSPQSEPLLESLAKRWPESSSFDGDALSAWFPARPGDPGVPDEERLKEDSPLDALRGLAGLVEDEEPGAAAPPGLYGAFSYEMVDRWEELPPRRPDPLDEPDATLVYALDSIAFDHIRREIRIVTRALGDWDQSDADLRHRAYLEIVGNAAHISGDPLLGLDAHRPRSLDAKEKDAVPDVSDETFVQSVDKFLDHIRRGDIFQGVLSRGLRMESTASPFAVYEALRLANPAPYLFYLNLEEGALLGASPETCIKVENGVLEIRPIAGTAPRGLGSDGTVDEELDARLAVTLLLDAKEQAEHVMLVDLARNDVARVSIPGSRQVVAPLCVEKYSHVQHLVSRVRGMLLPGLDALHAYRASANMGTLTGAPKLRAMELIRETEPFSRGFYGGAVGYLLQDGTFDSCIVIRSLRYRDGVYTTRAGAGIVAASDPEKELEETRQKALACRLAVARAEEESP